MLLYLLFKQCMISKENMEEDDLECITLYVKYKVIFFCQLWIHQCFFIINYYFYHYYKQYQ